MSIKRTHSKQERDYPGYSGNFSSAHSVDDDDHDRMDKAYSRNWEPPVDYQESLNFDKKWPGDIRYRQKYNPSIVASSTDQYDSEGNPKTLKRVLIRFAERTSMQGVPYINVSKTWYAKMIWTFLLIVAMSVMMAHLYVLFSSYLQFGKQTKVQLSFSNIKFPTVTLCNVNPVRSSQLHLGSQELRDFVSNIRPERVVTGLKLKKPPGQGGQNQGGGVTPTQPSGGGNTRSGSSRSPPSSTPPTPTSGRKKRFIDDLDFNFTNSKRDFEEPPNRKRPKGQRSQLREIHSEFNYLFSSLPRKTRVKMGHELDDMLVSCTFSGVVCKASHFRLHPTAAFGNCYTLENEDFISYRSGPNDGLELILFLETDEYISTIASGNGAQIHIHDTNTWPDPETQGMAVSAAMETNIAMRMVQIQRLSRTYDVCETGDTFFAKYGRKYTRQTCQLICVQERIVSQCGCYDEEKYELHENIGTDLEADTARPCRRSKDVQCMLSIQAQWETGDFTCSCHNPCNETSFQRLLNSRSWPSDAYASILVQYLCNNMNDTECEKYEKMDARKLSHNFMKVNIYFDDLNYEQITEAPDYEDVQFLSDIGGTVGLWVGLSVLSLAEVVQFFTELFHFLCCVKPNRKKKDNNRRDLTSRRQSQTADPTNIHPSHRLQDMDKTVYLY